MCMDEIIGQCGDVHRHRSGKGRDGQGWEGNEEIALRRWAWTRMRGQWGDWQGGDGQGEGNEETGICIDDSTRRSWAWVKKRGQGGNGHGQREDGQGGVGHGLGGEGIEEIGMCREDMGKEEMDIGRGRSSLGKGWFFNLIF